MPEVHAEMHNAQVGILKVQVPLVSCLCTFDTRRTNMIEFELFLLALGEAKVCGTSVFILEIITSVVCWEPTDGADLELVNISLKIRKVLLQVISKC